MAVLVALGLGSRVAGRPHGSLLRLHPERLLLFPRQSRAVACPVLLRWPWSTDVTAGTIAGATVCWSAATTFTTLDVATALTASDASATVSSHYCAAAATVAIAAHTITTITHWPIPRHHCTPHRG